MDHIDSSPVGNYFSRLEGYNSWLEKINIVPKFYSFSQSASPSNSVSWHGLLQDSVSLQKSDVWKYFQGYVALVKANTFWKQFQTASHLSVRAINLGFNLSRKKSMVNTLGQLAFKEEAAGKLRVFALVDGWTQSLLKPLHDELFRLLRLIPNDGTFDQDSSVLRSIEKSKKAGCAFSFDLSAATDRLPIAFQSALLDRILPLKVGNCWAGLLVERDYYLPQSRKNYGIEEESVRYKVGDRKSVV